MRDDAWLFMKLDEIWDRYFSDVPQENDVRIVWGRRARTRLGSIKPGENQETIITINRLFQDFKIPEYVIDATIAHELAHYAHGFHSPLEQKFETPHAGGVIHGELAERGLAEMEKKQKKWLKENWRTYIEKNFPRKSSNKRRQRRVVIKWI